MAKKGTSKYYSSKQEKRVAKEINGRLIPASGALWGSPGDVRNDHFLIEAKTTEKTSYSLKLTSWNKICDEALHDGMRIPVMCVEIRDVMGDPHSIAVIRRDDFEMYKDTHDFGFIYVEDKKSFQIKTSYKVITVYENIKVIHRLVVIPWGDFLEYAEEVRKGVTS